jgi:hypothetical protein
LIASEADRLEAAVIAWRRDIHAGGIKGARLDIFPC